MKALMEGAFENGFSLVGFSVYSTLRLLNKSANHSLSSEVSKAFVVEGGYINNYNNVNNCNVKTILDPRKDLLFPIRREAKLFPHSTPAKNSPIICTFPDLKTRSFFSIILDIFLVDMRRNQTRIHVFTSKGFEQKSRLGFKQKRTSQGKCGCPVCSECS